jgi:hypothetical protein
MSSFGKRWQGRFESLLSWQNFDDFWTGLIEHDLEGWYIYAIGQALPTEPNTAEQTADFLNQTATLLHKEHQQRYCGIVYVDDKIKPQMIKIYDPNNLGVSCGFSETPPLPGWVLSKQLPENIEAFQQVIVVTGKRKRWWQNIFSA